MPGAGVDNPVPAAANVAAYWAAIQQNEHAARVLVELRRGLAERLELIRSGAFDKMMKAADEGPARLLGQIAENGRTGSNGRESLNGRIEVGESSSL